MHPSIGTHDPLGPRLRALGGAAGETCGYLYAANDNGAVDPSAGDAIGFGDASFYVRAIERRLANEIIAACHYSGRTTLGSTLHLGVYLDGQMLGAMQYGYALNWHSPPSVVAGTATHEYLELNRMWLDDRAPKNSESHMLALSIRFIRRARPAVKWIQSFADERCGLFGTVYQAAGFTFHGEHRSRFYELDGEWYHKILLTKKNDNGAARDQDQAGHRAGDAARPASVPLPQILEAEVCKRLPISGIAVSETGLRGPSSGRAPHPGV